MRFFWCYNFFVMKSELHDWYEKQAENADNVLSEIFSDGVFVSKIFSIKRGYLTFDGKKYFVKEPHSRSFKQGRVGKAFSARDNNIAMASELLSEKKYQSLNYLTARHYPVKKEVLDESLKCCSWLNSPFYISVSPIIFNGTVSYATMFDLQTQEHLFVPRTRMDDKMFLNFETALKNKNYFLRYMNQECYDEYIKYILLSIFEFSDDEHLGNVILCQSKQAKKFEHLFVYDKESTAFNPFIAQCLSSSDVSKNLRDFRRFNGVPIANKDERSMDRIFAVTRLVSEGKLPEKYCKFLNEIAGIDYSKFAREVFEETGIKLESKQIDMYKFGSECAGNIVIREM